MLPLYVSYFAGTSQSRRKTALNACAFVAGFTLVFVTLGVFAATVGGFFLRNRRTVEIVCGVLVLGLGAAYTGIIKLPFLQNTLKLRMGIDKKNMGLLSTFLFGVVFSIGWTPCVGTFLGAALMMAASAADRTTGALMLLCFSAGIGIPFLVSALLLDAVKAAFDFIKRHYRVINIVSGSILMLTGIAMITGYMGRLLAILSV